MSVGSLVLGIVGLLISLVPFFGMYAIPFTLLAVILGALGMKAANGRGLAISGLICGVLGTVIAAWWMYATSAVGDAMTEVAKDYEAKAKAEAAKP